MPRPSYVRDINADDIARLNSGERSEGEARTPLQQVRFKHHLAAQLLAQGLKSTEVAASVGYTTVYIDDFLKKDPTFQQLLVHYASQNAAAFAEAQARLGLLGMTAVELMQEKLDDPSEELSMETLRKTAEFAMDRSIAPSKSAKGAPLGGGGVGAPPSVSINLSFEDKKPTIEQTREARELRQSDDACIVDAEVIYEAPEAS